jgi:signal transduction histidine kinase
LGSESNLAGDEISRRWREEVPGAGRALPLLVARLAQLAELERGFDVAVEREKLRSLKQFAYGAGHEINNPLANISTRAQTLLGDEQDPERRRKLATINSQAFRAHEMIADLMLFAQPPRLERQRVDLVRLVEQLLEQLATQARERNVQTSFVAATGSFVVSADPHQLQVALAAVCANGLEAMGRGGRIEIELRDRGVAETNRRMAEISIRDSGPGIPAEVRRHMFDPFFSGREAGRGVGFGLSKCWRIITDHGGSVAVDSQLGGTTFTVSLPLNRP